MHNCIPYSIHCCMGCPFGYVTIRPVLKIRLKNELSVHSAPRGLEYSYGFSYYTSCNTAMSLYPTQILHMPLSVVSRSLDNNSIYYLQNHILYYLPYLDLMAASLLRPSIRLWRIYYRLYLVFIPQNLIVSL